MDGSVVEIDSMDSLATAALKDVPPLGTCSHDDTLTAIEDNVLQGFSGTCPSFDPHMMFGHCEAANCDAVPVAGSRILNCGASEKFRHRKPV
jgi:hypothetical protein